MKGEIDLLGKYPKSNRNLTDRVESKTEQVRTVARQFGFDYFDGERRFGYGGFVYDPRFWSGVVKDIFEHYSLDSDSTILDVGCGKGFMLYDFLQAYPNLRVEGIDISSYALENAKDEVKKYLKLGSAVDLPYDNQSFDLVISINTIHNLNEHDCKRALTEIQRVARKHAYVTVDAYVTEDQRKRMFDWNLTALTIKSVKDWKEFFKSAGYTHDFYWFMP